MLSYATTITTTTTTTTPTFISINITTSLALLTPFPFIYRSHWGGKEGLVEACTSFCAKGMQL